MRLGIPQHGVCSIKCSYDDKATDAEFYAADVAGSAICGLPFCCQLHLVELHCAVGKCSSKVPLPAVKEKGDLQALYRDRFDGIGEFEGEYHIITDPNVLPVVHAQRKYPICIKDDINPFAPGDFAEKRVLKLVEWFSGHCRAIKS